MVMDIIWLLYGLTVIPVAGGDFIRCDADQRFPWIPENRIEEIFDHSIDRSAASGDFAAARL